MALRKIRVKLMVDGKLVKTMVKVRMGKGGAEGSGVIQSIRILQKGGSFIEASVPDVMAEPGNWSRVGDEL